MPQRPSLSGTSRLGRKSTLYNRNTLSCAIIEWASDSPTGSARGEFSLAAPPSHGVSRSVAVSFKYGDG